MMYGVEMGTLIVNRYSSNRENEMSEAMQRRHVSSRPTNYSFTQYFLSICGERLTNND